MSARLCPDCGDRAVFIVEPVGRYDWAGWADVPACADHLGAAVTQYVTELPRVQVRYLDTPQLPDIEECANEGCERLVADGFGLCLECERALFGVLGERAE